MTSGAMGWLRYFDHERVEVLTLLLGLEVPPGDAKSDPTQYRIAGRPVAWYEWRLLLAPHDADTLAVAEGMLDARDELSRTDAAAEWRANR